MIELGDLKIEGFLSIAEMDIPLNQKYIVWLKARNGTGKSSILESIAWCLFGNTFKNFPNVSMWEWVRPKSYQGTKVEIFFQDQGNIFQVIRCKDYTGKINGSKGKDQLMFFINGEEIRNKKKKEIQDEIDKALGMTWEVFKNSVMFGQGATRLIQESNSDKKKLFEEIFDIDWINESKEYATKEWRKSLDEKNHYENELDKLENYFKEAKKTLDILKDSEKRFREDKKATLINLKKQLKDCEVEESKAESIRECLAMRRKELAEIDEGDNGLSYLKEESNRLQEKIQLFHRHGLHGVITEIIALVKKSPKKAIKALTRVRDMMEQKDKIQLSIIKLNEDRKLISNEVHKLKSTLSTFDHKIERARSIKEDIQRVKKKKVTVESPKYVEKLDGYKERSKELKTKIEFYTKEVEEWQWVIQEPFGNKGIKSYIIESHLNTLNDILDRYADTTGLRVEFGIDLNTARKDFYALVEIEGHVVDYAELSGGQKQLVNVSIAFAMHEIKGINILFLDEVLESLSKDNVDIVCELIDRLSFNRSIFMVSHQQSLPLKNCKVIKLEKEKGLTIISK